MNMKLTESMGRLKAFILPGATLGLIAVLISSPVQGEVFLSGVGQAEAEQKNKDDEITPITPGKRSVPRETKPGKEKGIIVEARKKTNPKKYQFDTRLVEHLQGFKPVDQTPVNIYGGRTDMPKREATGYFYTEKVDGRWWMIDPEGCLFLHRGITRVKPAPGPNFRAAYKTVYNGDRYQWAEATQALLLKYGFNGYACWTLMDAFENIEKKLPHTADCFFARKYAESKGTGGPVTGHFGFDNELIPVFEPDFKSFCEKLALDNFVASSNDPYLVGIFTDNELQLPQDSLDRHLTVLDKNSAGRKAATAWLQARKKRLRVSVNNITETDRDDWIVHVMETYYSAVCGAIRNVDKNHMIIGTRFWSADKDRPKLWKVAGQYLDVVTVNAYGIWTPTEEGKSWERWSGKPFIVSEFYSKGADSGLPNTQGAGWTVATQKDRGRFFQNYVLGLLESRACVGWHYFTYADNDPTPRNTSDSNKGIVNCHYEPWTDMLEGMGKINHQSYAVADWFDRK